MCGWRHRGEGQAGFHHHIMEGKKSPQYNVPLFLQHRQGHGSRNYFTLLALVWVAVG